VLAHAVLAAAAAATGVPADSGSTAAHKGGTRKHQQQAQQQQQQQQLQQQHAGAGVWLAGPCAGLWLQQVAAVLAAADAPAEAVLLLLQLLDAHVKRATHAPAGNGHQREQQAQAGVPLPCVLALLEGLQDAVAASGLLPQLLEVCLAWALPVAPSPAAAAAAAAAARPPGCCRRTWLLRPLAAAG
jgi:hypothetical protein